MKSKVRESLRLTVDYNNMMYAAIGEKGISKRQLSAYRPLAAEAYRYVAENRGKDELFMGWTELPYTQKALLADIKATAKKIRKEFKYFVVLGIGGSALGPQMVFTALCHLHFNDLPDKVRKAPRFYVEDNIDPVRMHDLLEVIDPQKTCFNVISKSGKTSETMTQYLVIADILEKAGVDLKNNLIFTTDAEKGNLVQISEKLGGVKSYVLPDGVGGRFSELSPVGLLPAAVCGIDVKTMLEGAAYMDKLCRAKNMYNNPALISAVLQHAAWKTGRNISVLMPYSDNLRYLSDWFAQLWAESIGKNKTWEGMPCNMGQTPVKALGATDQHSQIQLYTEGPYDKVVTFVSIGKYKYDMPIPEGCQDLPDVAFLGGHTMEELIKAENKATAYALMQAHRMNYTVNIPELNAFTMGELIYYFEMQTAYMGALLHVNAYDQPGVEDGKIATFALLGKPGFEEKRFRINMAPMYDDQYTTD